MKMADGRVTYAAEGEWHVLRYFGRVDYTMAAAIERFIDGLTPGPSDHARPFLFDLSCARLLDSTNLGLIARVVERARALGAGRSLVLSQCGDMDDVVRSMGFEAIVDLTSERPASVRDGASCADAEVVTDEATSQGEMLRTMLEAHRALASLDDEETGQWRDVVTMLEAEMRSR
jgi:anti-anti-sigma regulatory factor